jgi:hypothetical protein
MGSVRRTGAFDETEIHRRTAVQIHEQDVVRHVGPGADARERDPGPIGLRLGS